MLRRYWLGKVEGQEHIKLVGAEKTALDKVCQRERNGEPLRDWWNQPGRKALVPIWKLREKAVDRVANAPGLSLKEKDVHDAFSEYNREIADANGVVPEMSVAVASKQSTETARRNVLKMRALHERRVLAPKTIAKTVQRFIGKNSIMSAVCLLVMVAASHYRLQEEYEVPWQLPEKIISRIRIEPEQSKQLT